MAAFAKRAAWIRPLGTKSYTDQINNMIEHYGEMGVVEFREGPTNRPEFPSVMEVEQLDPRQEKRLLKAKAAKAALTGFAADESVDEVDLTDIPKVHRFPYGLRR